MLRLVYGRAGRVAEITAMYQAAAAAAPDQPQLLEGVFAAHIRLLPQMMRHTTTDNNSPLGNAAINYGPSAQEITLDDVNRARALNI